MKIRNDPGIDNRSEKLAFSCEDAIWSMVLELAGTHYKLALAS